MNPQIDRAYLIEKLTMLLNTPSPTGYTHHIMDELEKEFNSIGYTMTYTNKGCGVVTVLGQDPSYEIGISAHVDTLGAMVRSIKDNGRIRMTSIGGYMMGAIENEYCQIHTRDGRTYDGTILITEPSLHVSREARDVKREEAIMEIRLDELAFTKQEVEALGIRVGDFVSFDPRVQVKANGYIKSRHLDDKAGVAAVLGLLKWMKDEAIIPVHTLQIFIATYEEVGHGSSFIPHSINEMIAVDMGALGDDLSGSEQKVSICAKDSYGPYDYQMTSRMIELAEQLDIGYAVDIYPNYGSDASAAQAGGADIRAALIGPGVHASHSMERTHIDAVANTAALLAAYVTGPVPAKR